MLKFFERGGVAFVSPLVAGSRSRRRIIFPLRVLGKTSVVTDAFGLDPEEWARGRARVGGDRAGDGCNYDRADFSLPPGVDDGATVVANLLAIPHARFRVDWFAYRSQEAQRAEAVLFNVLVSPLHERTDRSASGIENADLVVVDDLPEAGEIRPAWRAFIDDDRGSILSSQKCSNGCLVHALRRSMIRRPARLLCPRFNG